MLSQLISDSAHEMSLTWDNISLRYADITITILMAVRHIGFVVTS